MLWPGRRRRRDLGGRAGGIPAASPALPGTVADSDAITQLLRAHRQGDEAAFDRVMSLVYDDLRRVAQRQLVRLPAGATLNATAVVHETYFHLVDETSVPWESRGHFFAIAARAMRRVIIDHVRARTAQKRGGGLAAVTLDPERLAVGEQAGVLLAVDEALQHLAGFNPRLVKVAECRLFAGLTEEETASAVGVSLRTVQRDWVRARAWLQQHLGE